MDDTLVCTNGFHDMCGTHLWPQRHRAWCGLSPHAGTRVPKDLCTETVREAMGAMPCLDEVTRDATDLN